MSLMQASKLISYGKSALSNTRKMSAVSGPPTVKISNAEKAVHGVVLFVGMMTIPTWVLVNIKNYRGKE